MITNDHCAKLKKHKLLYPIVMHEKSEIRVNLQEIINTDIKIPECKKQILEIHTGLYLACFVFQITKKKKKKHIR